MSVSLIEAQVELEARQFLNGRNKLDSIREVSYRIQSHPKSTYRPPDFLRQTAVGDEFKEFADLLHELWELNEEHVGERVLEVNVCFALTGAVEGLAERFRRWCERYFRHRLDRHNPRDGGDDFLKFLRLLEEHDRLMGARANTLDYLCFDRSRLFVVWLLFQATWRQSVEIVRVGDYQTALYTSDPLLEKHGTKFIQQFGLGRDDLNDSLGFIAESAGPGQLSCYAGLSREDICNYLDDVVADIQQMRPFLVWNFRPEKSVVELHDSKLMAWGWCANHGIGRVHCARSRRQLLENVPRCRGMWDVVVNADGLLTEPNRPWITAVDPCRDEDIQPLMANAFLLDQLRDSLFELYDRIDFNRIQRRNSPNSEGRLDEKLLALSCQALAEAAPQRSRPARQRIRSLRLLELRDILEKQFDCEVAFGKGSEITVYRKGARKYCLGRHKRDRTVHPVQVKQVLSRLNITKSEWARVVPT